MPPAMESQMLRGVPSRKRSLLENKCTIASATTASKERTVTTDMPLGVPCEAVLKTAYGCPRSPFLSETRSFVSVLGAVEPGAGAPAPGSNVEVVLVANDPDRYRTPQRPVITDAAAS